MKYFEYECNVLEKLNEILIVESTNITNSTIRFNLPDNFHCELDRNTLRKAHEEGCSEYNMARQIKEIIRSEYVEAFVKRKTLERKEMLKSD